MQPNLPIGKGSFQSGHGKLTVYLCIPEGAFHYTAVAEYGIQTFIPFLLNKKDYAWSDITSQIFYL